MQHILSIGYEQAMKDLACEVDATNHGSKADFDRVRMQGRRAYCDRRQDVMIVFHEIKIVEANCRLKNETAQSAREADHTQCGACLVAVLNGIQIQ
ncbi:MAG: hypothetical protein V4801_16185 [Burkholderia gladioli]